MPGTHEFTMYIEGIEPVRITRKVGTQDGQTIALAVDLGFLTVNPLPGQAPPGGVVYLDGTKIGTIPLIRKKVRAGEHRLVVRWEGYKPFERTVVIPSLPAPGLNVGDASPPP
jgi:hypothetical protein